MQGPVQWFRGWALVSLFLLACSPTASDKSRIDDVEPALVTSLIDNPIAIRGQNFFLAATVDLEGDSPAEVNAEWRAELDGIALTSVTFENTGSISAVVPSGLPAGSYELKLFAPDGSEVMAPEPFVISDEPLGLPLSIESAPGGVGSAITDQALRAGDVLAVFAVVRDSEGQFLTDVEVSWEVDGGIGTLGQSLSSETSLLATTVGSGKISASHEFALPATTGELTVSAAPASALFVVDAAGAPGADVGDVTMSADEEPTYFAVSRDAFGNYVADVNASWSLTGSIGLLSSPAGLSTNFDATTPGTGAISATDATLGVATTGTLTVVPGRAAVLSVVPNTLVVSADASPVAFTATAIDADGNATTDTGDLSWSVSSGPISQFTNSSTGAFDPTAAGTGRVSVTSSHGPSAESGDIEIQPGAASVLAVAPDTQTLSADDSPFAFGVTGIDADGNATTDLGTIAWSVSQGPIDALDSLSGVLDPQTAGTGRITATSSHPGVFDESGDITIEPGIAASLEVTPDTLLIVQRDVPANFDVIARDADNNLTLLTGVLTWIIDSGPITAIAADTGLFTPTAAGTGAVRATSSHGALVTDVSGAVTVLQEATLDVVFTVPPRVTEGQSFSVTMRVTNSGESGADTVVPSSLTLGGTSTAILDTGPTPASATIAPGAFADFTFGFTAGASGTLSFSGLASGTDATTANAVSSATGVSGNVTVQTPPLLTVAISMDDPIGLGSTFDVTMVVSNAGEADAINVLPDDPLLFAGTANVTELSGPVPGSATVPGGGNTAFVWTYSADSLGTVILTGGADGEDANTGDPAIAPALSSNTANILELESVLLADDPFGDGTSFAFVFAHDGQVFLGPAADGSSAVRMEPDGTGAQSINFSIAEDITGNTHDNNAISPYTSFGAPGCTQDTLECGPDNEDGRGHFASGIMNGTEEWMVAGGSRSGGSLDWVYMTDDTDYTDGELDFFYVDLGGELDGGTRGFSAAHFFADNLYLGFPDTGGGQPKLVRLAVTPPDIPAGEANGINPVGDSEVFDLNVQTFMDDGTNPSMIDAIWDFQDRLYIANPVGCFRTGTAPPTEDEDFFNCTPSDTVSGGAYLNKTSFQTAKVSDIEPADRAVPAFATYGGRLFMARNTTDGPQLWSCTPGSAGGPVDRCRRGDWSLIVANTGLPLGLPDTELSQFDNANNTKISFLAATSSTLYVGFDNSVDGTVLFKTEAADPTTAADFTGRLSCTADDLSCEGLGGNGLGFAPPAASPNIQIFDGIVVDFAGTEFTYLVVGDGAAGAKVFGIF